MKQLIYFFSALIIISSILSCGDKEDPESYEVRKREHRLFRCKFNGKEWAYTGKEYWDLIHHIRSAYYEEDSSLLLDAYYIPDKETIEHITLYSENGLKIGLNKLDKRKTVVCDKYLHSDYYIDILDIDTLNHIIAGTFECMVDGFSDTIVIKDGEFDLKMDTWVKK